MTFSAHKNFAARCCRITFVLGIAYLAVTLLGFLSLDSPEEPIGDPFFTMMEVLILVVAPATAISLGAIHYCISAEDKPYSMIATLLMFLMAGLSSAVHFSILSLGKQVEFTRIPEIGLLFSFKWPSLDYALDILAWDWFYGLSLLFLAAVFKKTRREKRIRALLIIAGILCLAGLAGVPWGKYATEKPGNRGLCSTGPIYFSVDRKEFQNSKGSGEFLVII